MRKILLTPGPLNCSLNVKKKMLLDVGSRDYNFSKTIKEIRENLVKLVANNTNDYKSILFPGSGTYAIESVLSSVLNKNNKLGLLINGSYGKRILEIANIHKINKECIYLSENKSFNIDHLKKFSSDVSHIAVVHCETTTGILNNIESIGKYFNNEKTFIVDAMSSFGGIPIDVKKNNIDYLISSSNKCLHGPPGISFCIAKKEKLKNLNNKKKTLSLDLKDQYEYLELNNQFRFTPPTHIVNSLNESIKELQKETILERNKKYIRNNIKINKELKKLKFKNYELENNSNIISTWYYPKTNFDFEHFYNFLESKDILIYPGKLLDEDVFRIGNIGDLSEEDINYFIENINNYYNNFINHS